MVIATRFYLSDVETLSPVTDQATIAWNPNLIFPPGVYDYGGTKFDMRQPGLYRYVNPFVNTTQMIVHDGDPVHIASGLAGMISYGRTDEQALPTIADQRFALKTSKIRLQCTSAAVLLRDLLAQAGYQTRLVRFLTMETPNNYADGHVAVEVFSGDSWRLFDVSLGLYWPGFTAYDVVQQIAAGTDNPQELTAWGIGAEPFTSGQFDATSYAGAVWSTLSAKQDWASRIFQAVGIDRPDGSCWWLLPDGSEHRQSWVEYLAPGLWLVTPPQVWMDEFYP